MFSENGEIQKNKCVSDLRARIPEAAGTKRLASEVNAGGDVGRAPRRKRAARPRPTPRGAPPPLQIDLVL